jgi:hypothetical protein
MRDRGIGMSETKDETGKAVTFKPILKAECKNGNATIWLHGVPARLRNVFVEKCSAEAKDESEGSFVRLASVKDWDELGAFRSVKKSGGLYLTGTTIVKREKAGEIAKEISPLIESLLKWERENKVEQLDFACGTKEFTASR